MTAATDILARRAGERRTVGTRRPRPKLSTSRLFLWLGLCLMSLVQLLPFWVAVTTSLKSPTDTSLQILPPLDGIYLENFRSAIVNGDIPRAMGNSLLVTVVSTVLTCLIGSFAAYPLARYRTRINRFVYAFIIALIMIPPLSTLVPLYTMLAEMGATNTYWGIILVMLTGHLPLAIFLYAAFIRSIPSSLEEAASIDGAGPVRIFVSIILPLLKPVTGTVVILTAIGIWNEYALSSYLLFDRKVRTIAPSIASFFSAESANLGAASAASLLAVVPVVFAYLFLQKYFIAGMVAGAER